MLNNRCNFTKNVVRLQQFILYTLRVISKLFCRKNLQLLKEFKKYLKLWVPKSRFSLLKKSDTRYAVDGSYGTYKNAE